MAARTFLALDIDSAARSRLAAVCQQLGRAGARVRWVVPENLHVTLNVLGDVADEKLVEVCEVVSAAAGQIEPFDFEVCGVLCVPPAGRLRMFWAGVEEAAGRMEHLYQRLNDGLAGMDLHRDNRPFKPHITLGRVRFAKNDRELRRQAENLTEQKFGPQRAGQVVVYTSKLTPAGPVYTPVAGAELGG
ncbi:MAG: RNA 2',3'-cyclic phosphodiesterase [Planctomycetota bacterium]|nr:RNA 2',3'-cyclic phosphodiesterase [Planctomycetota bacterium]